ncbi:MAG: hypothetical protein M3R00_05895 [Pseudomonadota bacterium]|nr:hypothetical protein [Pseudomonadota bacterium]
MNKDEIETTAKERYLELLADAKSVIARFESGQLDHDTALSQLNTAYKHIQQHEQANFEQILSTLEPKINPFIREFFANDNLDEKALLRMTALAVMVVGYLNEHLDCVFPLILKPNQCNFLLNLMSYLTNLGARIQIHKDFDAALLLTGFVAKSLAPFVMNRVFLITAAKNASNKASLFTAVNIDMRTFGEWLIQQHIVISYTANRITEAEECLLGLEDFVQHATRCPSNPPSVVQEAFNAKLSNFKSDFKLNRSHWKKDLSTIRHITKQAHVNAIPSFRYYLWAKYAATAKPPQLGLALCYLNIALDIFAKLPVVTPPLAMFQLYKVIAANYVGAKQYSAAITIYEIMLERYPTVLRHLPEFHNETIALGITLTKLKSKAYEQLTTAWQAADRSHITALTDVHFNAATRCLSLTNTNIAWLQILTRQLKLENITHHFNKPNATITLSAPYQINAEDLVKLISVTQSKFVNREKILERGIEYINRLKIEVSNEQDEAQDSPAYESQGYYSPPSPKQIRQPRIPKSLQHANNNNSPKKSALPPTIITHSWGDDLPTFHPTQGCVYPIPNPDVNTGVPSGIFYGYLDIQALAMLDTEKLSQFETVLARGKLVAKGDAHGIRSVNGELPADSPYLFKINIHGEDIRLYGRKVADKTQSGDMKILIVFDQAVRHNQTLQLIDVDDASLKKCL